MVYDYVVTLKNERRRSVDAVSILVILISALAFLLVLVRGLSSSMIFAAAAVLLVAGLAWLIFRRKNNNNISFAKLLIIAGITWFAMPFLPWMGLLILLLSLLEKPAKMPLEIGFTHDRVVMNNIFRKKYHWMAFTNVLLKDGMLTLDFKNNRVFQKETIDEEGDAEEDEFNEYCRQRLSETG
jgi:LPXTG-motif cell wall-anchored protein